MVRPRRSAGAAIAELTPREREVLDFLVPGLSNPEICDRLVISEATAKTYESGLVALGARTRE